MTLASLTIQLEAWLQQELATQQAVRAALAAIEEAVRAGAGAEVDSRAKALESALAECRGADARRRPLLARLAAALGVPAGEVRLPALLPRLVAAGIETQRVVALQGELKAVATDVLRLGRRLAAQAHYHRGLFEELCRALTTDSTGDSGALVDARA